MGCGKNFVVKATGFCLCFRSVGNCGARSIVQTEKFGVVG